MDLRITKAYAEMKLLVTTVSRGHHSPSLFVLGLLFLASVCTGPIMQQSSLYENLELLCISKLQEHVSEESRRREA